MNKRYKNNVIINEKEVIKKYNKNIFEIYELFELVNFENYPKVIEYDEENIRYEYIKKTKYHEKIKNEEFIKTVALLHSKTQEYKEVGKDKYKKIYDLLNNNINYMKRYYDDLINNIEEEIYPSPSSYLISRNYTSIIMTIDNSINYLKKWYKIVENKTNERVCVIHNNLSINHFIKSDKNYLISFDRARVDTPVLDLYILYKKELLNINFEQLFEIYNNNFKLNEEEIYLFYTLISIPLKITKIKNELENTCNISEIFRYMHKTLNFVNKNK